MAGRDPPSQPFFEKPPLPKGERISKAPLPKGERIFKAPLPKGGWQKSLIFDWGISAAKCCGFAYGLGEFVIPYRESLRAAVRRPTSL